MASVKEIYDDMWAKSSQGILHGQYELDTLIDNPADTRRGVTALAYLKQDDSSLGAEIAKFIGEVRSIEPNQYYYPACEHHVTLLSVITCAAGIALDHLNTGAYVEVFQEQLAGIAPIEIDFRGITASSSCIVLQGFPRSDSLAELRDRLRSGFKQSPLYSTLDSRYRISTAHSTLVRFKSPLTNRRQLVSLLSAYREHPFGTITLNDIDLVFNNWYQNLAVTKLLGSYRFKEACSSVCN